MAKAEKVEVSKEDLQKAEALWASFTNLMKYSIISIVVLLGLMAIFLL